jgi:hypothetical protein
MESFRNPRTRDGPPRVPIPSGRKETPTMIRSTLVLPVALAACVAADAAVLVVPAPRAGLAPADLASRYATTSGLAGGITGRGARIAVVAASEPSLADVAAFRRRHGLPPTTIDRVAVAGGAAPAGIDPTMTILLEWAGALAPRAGLTAVVGDPWQGLAAAILDDAAPVLVLPALDAATPPDATARLLVRVLYDRRLVDAGTVLFEVPGPVVAEVLFALAEQQGQTIVVPAGSPLAGGRGVLTVGGTALRGASEVVWDEADGRADVAALASPSDPGYAFDWLGEPRCCAGGTEVAAAVWGGVAALLTDASDGAIPLASFVADAGAQQAAGGIVAFTEVAEPRGSDPRVGFGSPLVAGLVAALDCVGIDCGEGDIGPDTCGQGVCREGGVCERRLVADGTPCSPDACTLRATCQAGACAGGTTLACTDASVCTADACDPHRGCVHEAVSDPATCQLRAAGGDPRRCHLDWLVETGPDAGGPRRVICRDGDPTCDRDAVAGQCTLHVSVCAPERATCPTSALHAARPAAERARKSPFAAAARRALAAAVARAPMAGGCSNAAAVPVPAGRRLTMRVAGGRRASRPLTLACAGA